MVDTDADAFDDATDDEFQDELNSARRLDADSILDSLVPQSIDWRETVRRHPFGSVACVGLVGYLVGRTKGAAVHGTIELRERDRRVVGRNHATALRRVRG